MSRTVAIMTKRYRDPDEDGSRVARAKGSDLRVHFKNTRETAKSIHGMTLPAAKQYLQDVMDHKRCIVFRRFCGGVGRTALAKNEGSTNGQVSSDTDVWLVLMRCVCLDGCGARFGQLALVATCIHFKLASAINPRFWPRMRLL